MTDNQNPRFHDVIPMFASENDSYDFKATGPVREAAVHDQRGQLLGHVWSDGRQAAGFTRAENATPELAQAGGRIRRILADAYKAGVPAGELFDPALFAPEFELRVKH
ncbi:hypothetical protein OUY22_00650 [Nonomuraea sp. MCN248]|uniref:Uncharacterized protein n=1 Tax=Nonomuraea corallina TaxID=2989783 RepID=A0ABT4S4G3_9ACTN|nr:hypothetical protein [Nonomuraea corallina]MDA0631910.1 hypothetical protein [Nonomuraea corallina]